MLLYSLHESMTTSHCCFISFTRLSSVQARCAHLPSSILLIGVADISSTWQLHSASMLQLINSTNHRLTISDHAFGVSTAWVWNGLLLDIITSLLPI